MADCIIRARINREALQGFWEMPVTPPADAEMAGALEWLECYTGTSGTGEQQWSKHQESAKAWKTPQGAQRFMEQKIKQPPGCVEMYVAYRVKAGSGFRTVRAT